MTDDSARPVNSEKWSGPRERIVLQVIHWTVVLAVIFATTLLALDKDLSEPAVTALFGGALGHVGTAASQKLSSRG
jgi:hypothetical protein